MEIFLTAVLSAALIYLSIIQLIKNFYGPEPHESNARLLLVVLLSFQFSLLLNLFASDAAPGRVLLCLSVTIAAVQPLSCSAVPAVWHKAISYVSVGMQLLIAILFMMTDCLWDAEVSDDLLKGLSGAFCCVPPLMLIAGVYHRIRDLKVVMRTGTVWAMLCISVDAVYIALILLYALLMPLVRPWLSVILLSSVVVALCLRIRNHSVLVCMTSQERRIVESMRLSHSECIGDNPGSDLLYDNIYERVLRYFENEKPYLNTDLTISDVVDVMFTNKLYISKAISHCTGRNFCQFVNYHRVIHAVEMFRSNPQFKVVEIATLSGFNSTTSFNSAFRLYMGEKPGEWCRKERSRLTKK